MRQVLSLLPPALLLMAACLFAAPRPARAQPFVYDWWRFGTREATATLSYCVDARDPDAPVARRIGAALAGALLLQPHEYLIAANPGEANRSGEELDSLYLVLTQHCDVYLGFKLVPNAYPQWLTVTRPYYRSRYVYAAADPAWKTLGAMPRSKAIGATVGTAADLRLTQYLLSLGAGQRWDKYPMASDEAALRAVQDGTTGAALVWAPALWALAQTDPSIAAMPRMAPDPLPVSTADVGAVLLAKQSFLRASVDQAIAALTADGSIAAILAEAHFPADPVP